MKNIMTLLSANILSKIEAILKGKNLPPDGANFFQVANSFLEE